MDSAAPPYLQDITKPHTLHHTETNDHSKPAVEGGAGRTARELVSEVCVTC